jgi:adenylosuccinate synthase
MECPLCSQEIDYPVAVAPNAAPHHLMALCSYLAKQLLEQSSEVDPTLKDMMRREVTEIIEVKVSGRVANFFPKKLEELNRTEPCDEWQRGMSNDAQEVALRLAREFIPTNDVANAPPKPLWYYLDGEEKQYGPMSFHALQEAFEAKEVMPNTYLWNETMNDWQKLESLPKILKEIQT